MIGKSSNSNKVRRPLNEEMPGLDRNYKRLVDSLRAFLEKVRRDMDREESSGVDRESLFRTYGPLVFKKLNDCIAAIEKAAVGFTDDEHGIHKEYLQRLIHPLALESPFNRSCFEKPLGYPGDYITLEMIYSDPCLGETAFAQLMNFHSQTLPIAEAVRQRCQNIKEMMLETIRQKPRASFLSVGSGPAKEVREILCALDGCDSEFHLLDQDEGALEFSKAMLADRLDRMHFIHKPVINLIREGLGLKFDFIYSMGLIDYLSDIFARRLINRLYGLLNDGGLLVVSNASHNPHRIWMEHGSEWYLIYRDRTRLLGLAKGLDPVPAKVFVKDYEGLGSMFPFLVVER